MLELGLQNDSVHQGNSGILFFTGGRSCIKEQRCKDAVCCCALKWEVGSGRTQNRSWSGEIMMIFVYRAK